MSSARELIEKYLQNTLSAKEREKLLSITEDADNDALTELFHSMLAEDVTAPVNEERLRRSLQRVLAVDRPEGVHTPAADTQALEVSRPEAQPGIHTPAADTRALEVNRPEAQPGVHTPAADTQALEVHRPEAQPGVHTPAADTQALEVNRPEAQPGIHTPAADTRALEVNRPEAQPGVHTPAADTHSTPVLKVPWLRYAAAAVILIAAAGIYIWQKNKPTVHSPITAVPVKTGAPGGQKAVLTLADGTAITLDSTASGQLATQQGSRVLNSNGQVTYAPTGGQQDVAAFNTLRTARGGTYRLTLSDGTTVWLNAASSISYPVVFTGKERMVEMTGEAYFEVAPHAQMPFRVKVNDNHLVEVLGTQFNVKGYAEEALVSTTLLQGAVRVAGKVTLKPGQQAQAAGQQLQVKTLGKAGIAQAIAWKEGRFNFQDVHLQEVMRQLARWYDIEVVYEQGVPDLEFIGEIERSLPLTEVLKGLKMSGVNFRLEDGKRLVVSP